MLTIRGKKYDLNDEQKAGLRGITDAWLAEAAVMPEPEPDPDRGKKLDNGHTGPYAELSRKYRQKIYDYVISLNIPPVEEDDTTN